MGAATLSDSDDDPEEQRRRIEAEQAARDVGTAIGLVAGTVLALTQKESPEEEEMKKYEQTMDGM